MTDKTALDQIAALLGLWHTDPGNNPMTELLASISSYVVQTGRSVDTPEGA